MLGFLFISVLFLSVLVILRWSSLDPHNIKGTDGIWSAVVQAAIITVCCINIPFIEDSRDSLKTILASYILTTIYMPVLNPPVKYREDEYSNFLKRNFEELQTKFGGSIFVKIACALLLVILSTQLKEYWLMILAGIGLIIQFLKSLTLNLMVQSYEGEFRESNTPTLIEENLNKYSARFRWFVLAFILFSSVIGLNISDTTDIDLMNWNSYAAILGGIFISYLIAFIFE